MPRPALAIPASTLDCLALIARHLRPFRQDDYFRTGGKIPDRVFLVRRACAQLLHFSDMHSVDTNTKESSRKSLSMDDQDQMYPPADTVRSRAALMPEHGPICISNSPYKTAFKSLATTLLAALLQAPTHRLCAKLLESLYLDNSFSQGSPSMSTHHGTLFHILLSTRWPSHPQPGHRT